MFTRRPAAGFVAIVTVVARRARLARRGVLRPLDERLGRDQRAVLVLGDELQADPAPLPEEDPALVHGSLDHRRTLAELVPDED